MRRIYSALATQPTFSEAYYQEACEGCGRCGIHLRAFLVGSAVSLAQAGTTVVDIQVAGRWKSAEMPAHYAKAELAERGAIARFKDGKSQ